MDEDAGGAGPTPLTALYAAVPAAEEEDLLEQVVLERQQEEGEALASTWLAWPAGTPRVWDVWDGSPTDGEPDEAEPPEEEEQLPPLPQVLGLLEHRLGARVVPPEDEGFSPTAP